MKNTHYGKNESQKARASIDSTIWLYESTGRDNSRLYPVNLTVLKLKYEAVKEAAAEKLPGWRCFYHSYLRGRGVHREAILVPPETTE